MLFKQVPSRCRHRISSADPCTHLACHSTVFLPCSFPAGPYTESLQELGTDKCFPHAPLHHVSLLAHLPNLRRLCWRDNARMDVRGARVLLQRAPRLQVGLRPGGYTRTPARLHGVDGSETGARA